MLCCVAVCSPVAAGTVTDLQNVTDSIQTKQPKFTGEWERHIKNRLSLLTMYEFIRSWAPNAHICFHLHSYIPPSVTMQPAWLGLSLFSPSLPHFLLFICAGTFVGLSWVFVLGKNLILNVCGRKNTWGSLSWTPHHFTQQFTDTKFIKHSNSDTARYKTSEQNLSVSRVPLWCSVRGDQRCESKSIKSIPRLQTGQQTRFGSFPLFF